MRATNAIFNIRMAFKRLRGTRGVGNQFGNNELEIQQRLLVLALVELDDAIAVLQDAPGGAINPAQVTRLEDAHSNIVAASENNDFDSRMYQIDLAISQLDLADSGISPDINFIIGAGTLMD